MDFKYTCPNCKNGYNKTEGGKCPHCSIITTFIDATDDKGRKYKVPIITNISTVKHIKKIEDSLLFSKNNFEYFYINGSYIIRNINVSNKPEYLYCPKCKKELCQNTLFKGTRVIRCRDCNINITLEIKDTQLFNIKLNNNAYTK